MDSAAFVMPSKHFPTMGSTSLSTSEKVFMQTAILSILVSSMSWSFYVNTVTIWKAYVKDTGFNQRFKILWNWDIVEFGIKVSLTELLD